MPDLLISVIIPVYNAEKFLRKAVGSALVQPEVGEVLLVEDASPDHALRVCQELEKAHPEKVRLLQHPDQQNHGAGASRNLGILNARHELIAFLDADDYYLPGRFSKDMELLLNHPEADGVYNALGVDLIDEHELDRSKTYGELTTIKAALTGDALFHQMTPMGGRAGHIHLDTLTVKKSALLDVGMFETQLELTQDTHLIIKLAATKKLLPGINDRPVAMRGVHTDNRVKDRNKFMNFRPKLFKALLHWAIENHLEANKKILLWERLYFTTLQSPDYLQAGRGQKDLIRYVLLLLSFRLPVLWKSRSFYQKVPVIRHIVSEK